MNKRKLLALVLTGVMAISTLAGCGSSDTKTSDTDVKTSETAETSECIKSWNGMCICSI